MGPPLGGFITTYSSWHWIFLINVPIGLDRHRAGDALHRERAAEVREGFDCRRHGAVGDRGRGTDVRAVGRGLRDRALAGGRGDPADRRCGDRRSTSPMRGGRRRRSSISACCKLPTFRASLVGGFMFRIGVGAMPFLLPLLLQVGFKLSPFQSGLITFTSTLGALFMKAAAPRMLKRFGFRNVLIWNGILGGLSIAACAIFRDSTPFAVMIGVLMLGGFFRSLQFTSVNALAYAEVPIARMSRATALSAVGQQVSLATGVAVGALDRRDRGADERSGRHHGVGFPAGVPAGRPDRSKLSLRSSCCCRRTPAPRWPTGCRRPPRRSTSGWDDGAVRDIEGVGLRGERDGKIRRCCVIRSPSRWPCALAALVPASRRRATGQAVRRAALHRTGRRHTRRSGRGLHGADRQRPLHPARTSRSCIPTAASPTARPATTTAPSPISTPRFASIRTTCAPISTAATPTSPSAITIAPSPTSARRSGSSPGT